MTDCLDWRLTNALNPVISPTNDCVKFHINFVAALFIIKFTALTEDLLEQKCLTIAFPCLPLTRSCKRFYDG